MVKMVVSVSDKLWLPEGKHWGLDISHLELENAGDFTGGGHKQLWHTTEGTSLSGAEETLASRRDAPHTILDIRSGKVIQTIPFNKAARALEHVYVPETNRANCFQTELCGYAAQSGEWSVEEYRRIAALAVLTEHRTGVPRFCHVSFIHPHKLSPTTFVSAKGHMGHVHVPGNDHVDPGTGFHIGLLIELMGEVEAKYG